MSQVGLLVRHNTVVTFDDWIEVSSADEEAPKAASVISMISEMRENISRGIVPSVHVDVSSLPEIDELDDDAIQAFFDEID